MALNTTQITVLYWFYTCHEKGEAANFKGTIEHFGSVLRISEPMDVIKSLLDMGLISMHKVKLEVSITKAGIQMVESLKKK
jgi:hypothetical protein